MEKSDPISVLVVEDNELLRLGIRATLMSSLLMSSFNEAVDGIDAIEKYDQHQPDVVVMDIAMPNMDGIEATKAIKAKSPRAKIIILTAYEGNDGVYKAFAAGANGYCRKDSSIDHLVEGIQTVHAGELWLDSAMASTISSIFSELDQSKFRSESLSLLTGFESDFMHQLVSGHSISQICVQMNLEPGVSKACLVNILKKVASFENVEQALDLVNSDHSEHVVSTDSVLTEKYEVLAKLGQGGMSSVFKARHKALGKLVAVKILNGSTWQDRRIQTRFQREAQITSRLTHPYIIGVHDFGVSIDQPYIIMDYVDGPSLAQILDRCGPLNESVAIGIFVQLAEALDYAHTNNVVHRDLKPSNVMITCNGEKTVSRVVDFGIAQQLDVEQAADGNSLTVRGEVMGSPLYMSPEQCLGKPVDNKSDIYSLGCLMYESLHGLTPFVADSALETMQMHLRCEPSFQDTNISPAIRDLIKKCLEKVAEKRYSSMQEVRSELLQLKL